MNTNLANTVSICVVTFILDTIFLITVIGTGSSEAQKKESVTVQDGDLSADFRDNSLSLIQLSGVQS